MKPKTFLLFFLFFTQTHTIMSQNDTAKTGEMGRFIYQVNSSFWPGKEELSKIKSEMYFVLLHIRDSSIASFELFVSEDTVLRKYVRDFFTGLKSTMRFKTFANSEYIIPLVIKNYVPGESGVVYNAGYDNLLWKSRSPKIFNSLEDIFCLPLFIYRSRISLSGPERLAPKGDAIK